MKTKEQYEAALTKETVIGEVVRSYPEVIPIMIENGMHCIGCGASMFETLEDGFLGHGMDDKEIERILKEMNEYISENKHPVQDVQEQKKE